MEGEVLGAMRDRRAESLILSMFTVSQFLVYGATQLHVFL